MNAILKYYFDTSIYNIGFSFLVGLFFGFTWGIIMYPTFGSLIGLICFSYFRKNEYYFYYNLGYNKRHLTVTIWIINTLIMIVLLGGYLLIINLL